MYLTRFIVFPLDPYLNPALVSIVNKKSRKGDLPAVQAVHKRYMLSIVTFHYNRVRVIGFFGKAFVALQLSQRDW